MLPVVLVVVEGVVDCVAVVLLEFMPLDMSVLVDELESLPPVDSVDDEFVFGVELDVAFLLPLLLLVVLLLEPEWEPEPEPDPEPELELEPPELPPSLLPEPTRLEHSPPPSWW